MTVGIVLSWVAAALVSLLLGYLVTLFLWPATLSRALMWLFAPGIGLGLNSLIFVVFRRPMFTVEFALILVLAAAALRSGKLKLSPPSNLKEWRAPLPVLFLLCAGALALSGLVQIIERTPHGDWDAWNIWNSHSRYLYRDGPNWREGIHNTFHPDYPLLTPALVARFWRYAGAETPDSGGWLGIIFTLGGVAVLFAVLLELRDLHMAALAALVLLSTPFYLEYGVSQSADVPLSFYFLCTAALLCLQSIRAPGHRGLMVLAGFMAGFSGWTKNEGQLFILVVLVALGSSALFKPREGLRQILAFAAGLALPLAVILSFKITIDAPNDIFKERYSEEILAKIQDGSRYVTVLTDYWETFWTFGEWLVHPLIALLAFVALRGIDREIIRTRGWRIGLLTLIVVAAGYSAIYIITPMDLRWHLDSSLPRLMLQLWPSFLFLIAMAASPWQRD